MTVVVKGEDRSVGASRGWSCCPSRMDTVVQMRLETVQDETGSCFMDVTGSCVWMRQEDDFG